jgi:RNA ligase
LPEEFWADFDAIRGLIDAKKNALIEAVAKVHSQTSHMTDKEVGLSLKSIPEEVRPFIFNYRKNKETFDGRMTEKLFRMIRPTSNILPGYTPSYAMHRVMEEAA